MKKLIALIFIFSSLKNNAQVRYSEMNMFSPKTRMSLHLYSADSFSLSKSYIYNDVLDFKLLYAGRYQYNADTLFLLTNNNKMFTLKKETVEIYSPIIFDTLNRDEKFLATSIYYPNGQLKQLGSWDINNRKHGVWQYYDSTGTLIRKRLFKDDVLVDDNFKWPEEK